MDTHAASRSSTIFRAIWPPSSLVGTVEITKRYSFIVVAPSQDFGVQGCKKMWAKTFASPIMLSMTQYSLG
jgi:hypothetical protein